MYTLAFDTTASACSLALFEDDKPAAVFSKETDFGQAEMLMVEMKNMLINNHITFQDINLLAVCTGPGSFTGVRSSIAAARAFALACPNMSVCGISAFEAYISAVDESELAEVNAVVIETKRDDFYVQYFDNHRQKICAPTAARYDEIIHFLQGKKVTFIGDGVERFLSKPSGLSLHAIHIESALPIKAVAYCALNKYQKKVLDFPKPLYLKAPDVCVK